MNVGSKLAKNIEFFLSKPVTLNKVLKVANSSPNKTSMDHMVNVSNIFKFILYADGTNLFCTSKDIVCLSVAICNELIKLEKWFPLNKLLLNISKKNYMIFCKSQVNQSIQIRIWQYVDR